VGVDGGNVADLPMAGGSARPAASSMRVHSPGRSGCRGTSYGRHCRRRIAGGISCLAGAPMQAKSPRAAVRSLLAVAMRGRARPRPAESAMHRGSPPKSGSPRPCHRRCAAIARAGRDPARDMDGDLAAIEEAAMPLSGVLLERLPAAARRGASNARLRGAIDKRGA